MAGAAVLDFYTCWQYFLQLQHLDLRCYDSGLREDVLMLAAAPHLTYLSFADLGMDKWNGTGAPEDPSDKRVQVLDCLATAVRKSRKQPSKLFRINKRPFWYEWQARPVLGLPNL